MVACFSSAAKVVLPRHPQECGSRQPWKVLFSALQEGSERRKPRQLISGLSVTSSSFHDIDLQDLLETIPTLQ